MGQTVNLLAYAFGGSNPSSPTISSLNYAEVAQLIEHQPSKLRVAGLSPVFRSRIVLIDFYQHFSYFMGVMASEAWVKERAAGCDSRANLLSQPSISRM